MDNPTPPCIKGCIHEDMTSEKGSLSGKCERHHVYYISPGGITPCRAGVTQGSVVTGVALLHVEQV